jgi:hypothetical protein
MLGVESSRAGLLTRRLTVPVLCTHAVRRGSGYHGSWCVPHAVLFIVHLVWTSSHRILGLKPETGKHPGSDLVYSILSPEWNARISRRQGSLLTAVARLFRGIDLRRPGGSGEADLRRLDLVSEDSSLQHTNVGCLAGFV